LIASFDGRFDLDDCVIDRVPQVTRAELEQRRRELATRRLRDLIPGDEIAHIYRQLAVGEEQLLGQEALAGSLASEQLAELIADLRLVPRYVNLDVVTLLPQQPIEPCQPLERNQVGSDVLVDGRAEGAAARDHAVLLEAVKRGSDRRAADVQRARQLVLGGQTAPVEALVENRLEDGVANLDREWSVL